MKFNYGDIVRASKAVKLYTTRFVEIKDLLVYAGPSAQEGMVLVDFMVPNARRIRYRAYPEDLELVYSV